MSDRELLELAAKAAGINARWFKVKQWERKKSYPNTKFYCGTKEVFGTHHSKPWNPLADDGERYRLAKNLDIRIHFGPQYVTYVATDGIAGVIRWPEDEPDDAHAIVRAAAEIGKNMGT